MDLWINRLMKDCSQRIWGPMEGAAWRHSTTPSLHHSTGSFPRFLSLLLVGAGLLVVLPAGSDAADSTPIPQRQVPTNHPGTARLNARTNVPPAAASPTSLRPQAKTNAPVVARPSAATDRKSVVEGKRGHIGGRRI